MDLLDVTIVNVGVPTIQHDLAAGYSEVEWIISAYVLGFASILITAGRLGDAYGRKRLFMLGMALFTAASAVCGLSIDPTMLIASRAAQGLAAGLMVPQILAILRTSFPPHERARAIAVYGGVCGSATAVGLALGAVLIDLDLFGLSWRPIFLVNIPIGIATLIAAHAWLDESTSSRPITLDVGGVVLSTSAVILLILPLTEGRRLGWPSWVFATLAASAVVSVAFIAHQRRRTQSGRTPLVDLALFRSRAFSLSLFGWVAFWIVFGGFFLIWTLLMQVGLGWSPLRSGLTALGFAAATIVGAATSTVALTPHFGKWVLSVGALLAAAGLAVYGWIAADHGQSTSSIDMLFPLAMTGLGFGVVVAPTIDLILSDVPEHEAGAASGVLNTGQQIGVALGIALAGVVFFAHLDHGSSRGADAALPALSADLAAGHVRPSERVQIGARFTQCVRDRASQVDPSHEPAACRPPAAVTPPVAAALETGGRTATGVIFTRGFRDTLWWAIGALILIAAAFTALPSSADRAH